MILPNPDDFNLNYGYAEDLLEIPEVKIYEDVVLQHLGKLYFDKAEYEKALTYFNRALEIRILKTDQNLIDSTKMAIEATRKHLQG